jgi:hypothetical protein
VKSKPEGCYHADYANNCHQKDNGLIPSKGAPRCQQSMCVLPAELLPSYYRSFTPFLIRPPALANRQIALSCLSYKLSSVLIIPGVHRSIDLVPYRQPNANAKKYTA